MIRFVTTTHPPEAMTRNLLPLLLDLTPAEVRAAADAWAVTLTKRTHADNVALLYQGMTDRWSFEERFDALPPLARDILGVLVVHHPEGLARDALAPMLGADVSDLTDALSTLRAAALTHREPSGVLLVPREIGSRVARALRERGGEEAVAPSVPHLIAALDADELVGAARMWHIADVTSAAPGERERLIAELRRRVTHARTLAEVETALTPGARRIVAALREEPEPLPLADALAIAGAETPAARRDLLRELTASLLACHAWLWGERVLVMPNEFRSPITLSPTAPPPLVAVSAEPIGSWRHPHALAWDVLTLLRFVEAEEARWPVGGVAALAEDYALARHLARALWVGVEGGVPPGAALAFLAAVAQARGLLTERDEGGRRIPTVPDPVAWAKQGFAAHTRALWQAWRGLSSWPEGQGAGVQLWGVAWPAFRTRLLDALAECQPEQWHTLDNLLARLVLIRPPLLGDEFTAASAVGQTPADRDALTRACAEATLRTALTWFGVIEWGHAGKMDAVRLTDVGRWLTERGPEPHVPPFGATPLGIQPDLTVLVLHPEPAHLWPLLALAEPDTLDRVAAYRITAGSLRRALRRGLPLPHIVRFLESRTGGPLSTATRATLDDWARSLRRVTLERAVILATDDPDTLAELTAVVRAMGAATETLPDGRLLVRVPEDDDALAGWLADADLTPVWKG